MNNRDDFVRDSFERLRTEHASLGSKKTLVRSEEFGWSCVAHEAKAAVLEVVIRASVLIRLARDLAEDLVTTLRTGEHNRRTALGLRQIRERKRNENYGACCRCDHAASSSARFQSSAKAA